VLLADRILVLGPRPGTVVADLAVPLAHPRVTDVLADALAAGITAAVRDALAGAPDPALGSWSAR
jgi:NitT/TauT family transport system ATP-binding protein